ncbi:MAG: hypothetical protein JO047_10925 [Alphaproteobacteria bacterium]|nr:hypothetical protein [Alphaproteobacteria bacterium]
MSATPIGLDELAAAHRRVSRARDRALEDAYEFAVEDMVTALERDEVIVEAAFFLLIFGQIESRINELAKRRQRRAEAREAVRELPFERRLHMALPGRHRDTARQEIKRWYVLRNASAHGERLAADYRVAEILQRAKELDRLIDKA